MQSILNNYLCGNLTDAKAQARRHSWHKLRQFLHEQGGMRLYEASAVADWLKGKGTWQAACDAAPGARAQTLNH